MHTQDRFNNLPLADRYAALKAEANHIEALLEAAKAEIKATGASIIEGEHADVVVTLAERSTLNSALVKQLLTADQLKAVTKISLVETLRVKAKIAV